MTIQYYKFLPSGNPTVLVIDPPQSQLSKLAKTLLLKCEAEQVGFIDSSIPALTMMGGEFCLNASRAFGVWLYQEAVRTARFFELNSAGWSELLINVSGAEQSLLVQVRPSLVDFAAKNLFEVKILMDIQNINFEQLTLGLSLVHLPGISHLVLDTAYFPEPVSNEAGRILMQQLLDQYDLLLLPAAGCIWLSQGFEAYAIKPFVYVRDTDTIYPETACGSGTLAAALVQGFMHTDQLDFIQPSQEIIYVQKVTPTTYWVGGMVKLLESGQI